MAYAELKRTGPPGEVAGRERENPPRPAPTEYQELWHRLMELTRLGVLCSCGWSLAFAVAWLSETLAPPARVPMAATEITVVAPPVPPPTALQERPASKPPATEPLVVVSAIADPTAD